MNCDYYIYKKLSSSLKTLCLEPIVLCVKLRPVFLDNTRNKKFMTGYKQKKLDLFLFFSHFFECVTFIPTTFLLHGKYYSTV